MIQVITDANDHSWASIRSTRVKVSDDPRLNETKLYLYVCMKRRTRKLVTNYWTHTHTHSHKLLVKNEWGRETIICSQEWEKHCICVYVCVCERLENWSQTPPGNDTKRPFRVIVLPRESNRLLSFIRRARLMMMMLMMMMIDREHEVCRQIGRELVAYTHT